MTTNPANAIKDTMWHFLMDGGQKANIPALKGYVYDLIKMTTQKTAGQRQTAKQDIPWEQLDMTLMSIVIEATALVLSGELDRLERRKQHEESATLRLRDLRHRVRRQNPVRTVREKPQDTDENSFGQMAVHETERKRIPDCNHGRNG